MSCVQHISFDVNSIFVILTLKCFCISGVDIEVD